MQRGNVYKNEQYIGFITKDERGVFRFVYDNHYISNPESLPISVHFPLQRTPFISEVLFPFFFNMLAEGNIKKYQCRKYNIDEEDHFTRLLKTASHDTIGDITIKEDNTDKVIGLGLTEFLADLGQNNKNENR